MLTALREICTGALHSSLMREPHFHLFGVPVRVELSFLLTTLFFGLYRVEHRDNPVFWLAEWFVIVAVSILVHEFGHAFAYRRYGQKPAVALWGLGGLTYGEELLPPKRSIFVSFAGPLAQLAILGIPAYILFRLEPGFIARSPIGWTILADIAFLNIAWAVINLLPILPLDGGNICDSVLEIVHGEPRRQTARMISMVTAIGFVAYSIANGWGLFPVMFAGILFVTNLLAYLRVRNGSDRFANFQLQLPGASRGDDGAGRDNVVSMDKARKKRDKRSPAELITSGYEALEHRDYKSALRTTDRLRSRRLNGELLQWTNELAAWAFLGERNTVGAEEQLDQLAKNATPSTPLSAVLALAQKRTDAGVDLMVKAMVNEPEGGAKLIGIDLFAEYGMIHRLARELVDLDGGSGFEAAVSLEGMLHRLNRTQDASTVSDVIMMG